MKYLVHKRLKPFSAAHFLPQHDGPCRHVHGHNFHLEVAVAGEPTPPGQDAPDAGMVIEFSELKSVYEREIFPLLDHRLINDSIPELQSPTTEILAAWIFQRFALAGVRLHSVRLWETDDNSVTVSRD